MFNYIPLEQLIILDVNVSEKIENKNLKKFIFTSLKLSNKIFNNNDLIYTNYIEELNQYQILLINKNYKNGIFQIFELFYKEESFGLDLYLSDDFFCLYKNGSFYYFQTIDINLSIDEFLEFISKKFNSQINHYQKIEKNYLENLKDEYLSTNKKSTLKNINIKTNYSFKIYLFYIFLLISLFFYFFPNEENNMDNTQINNNLIEFEKLKKEYLFVNFGNDFYNILNNIKKYSLNLKLFEYQVNGFRITLLSSSKNSLYSFLNEYKDTLFSSSISHLEEENIYELVAHVKFSK